ncbi:hypothetical protein XENOCAPTIV_022574, partial [Xenoophorus captivus]
LSVNSVQLQYRTFHRPTYKVGYKTVTELEWRCCPGYSGEACHDGPTSLPDIIGPHRPGIKGVPLGPRPPVDQKPGGAPLDPGKFFPGIDSGQLPGGGGKPNYGVAGERLDRMEQDLRLLTQSLESLNRVVAGLEDRLRTSLREETNKFLVSLLPNPPRGPDSTVGFGVIPDGSPDGLEGGHDGQLKKLLEGAIGKPIPGRGSTSYLDEILDVKLAGVRTEILDGFERRLTGMENHCDEKIGEVQRQCQREHLDGQEQMQQSLDGRETGLREELGSLQAQIQGLTLTESCCGQRQLQTALADQATHIETLVETRLVDMEGRLNATSGGHGEVEGLPGGLDGFKTLLEDKLKTLEERVSEAVEELNNATTPALLEGQVVPALETEIESVRRRVEGDLSGIQKQLLDLELLCTSTCKQPTPQEGAVRDTLIDEECKGIGKKMTDRLDSHSNQLDRLNNTLNNLILRIAQEETEGSVQGEITLLKVNINSVNRTLKGLKDSITFIATEVGHANSSWEQRENLIVNQVQGITKLMGHQAYLLGASERRLAELRGELAALKRQLSGGLQGCRSTAMEVQKEVKVVDSRVSQVESQCSSLGELAENLERIRAELEKHSAAILSHVNGTLTTHSEQLGHLKSKVQDFASKDVPNQNDDH